MEKLVDSLVNEEDDDLSGDDSGAESPTAGVPVDPNAPLPSKGSEGHVEGTCKRCAFYPRGRCTNGFECAFCHYEHEKRKRKKKKGGASSLPDSPTAPISTEAQSRAKHLSAAGPPQTSAQTAAPQPAHSQSTGGGPSLQPQFPPPLYPAPNFGVGLPPPQYNPGALPVPGYPWGDPRSPNPVAPPLGGGPQVVVPPSGGPSPGQQEPGANAQVAGRVMMVGDLESAMVKAAAAAATPGSDPGPSLPPGPSPPVLNSTSPQPVPPVIPPMGHPAGPPGPGPPRAPAPLPGILPPPIRPDGAIPPPIRTDPGMPADPNVYRAILESKEREIQSLYGLVTRLEDDLSRATSQVAYLESRNTLLREHIEPQDRNTLLQHRKDGVLNPSIDIPLEVGIGAMGTMGPDGVVTSPSGRRGINSPNAAPGLKPNVLLQVTPTATSTQSMFSPMGTSMESNELSSKDPPIASYLTKRLPIIDPTTQEPIAVQAVQSPSMVGPPGSPPTVTPQITPPGPPVGAPLLPVSPQGDTETSPSPG